MKWLKRIAIAVVALVVVGYAAAVVGMYALQRDFQYDRSGKMFALSETKLTGAELVAITTDDGSKLGGWYQAPQPGKPLILYFRGNAQSFSREYERYEAFVAAGYGFLAFDYRGFPGSPGEITEAHILADGLAAFDWAVAKGFPIVLWGRSLGSGPATYVASLRDADALLLETPFDSAVSVGEERYPILPVAWLMSDQFRVDQWLAKVTEPVFVAHGTADTTIGVEHGKRAYDLAPNKDSIWIEEGADHSDLWDRGIWAKAQAFFERSEAKLGR